MPYLAPYRCFKNRAESRRVITAQFSHHHQRPCTRRVRSSSSRTIPLGVLCPFVIPSVARCCVANRRRPSPVVYSFLFPAQHLRASEARAHLGKSEFIWDLRISWELGAASRHCLSILGASCFGQDTRSGGEKGKKRKNTYRVLRISSG